MEQRGHTMCCLCKYGVVVQEKFEAEDVVERDVVRSLSFCSSPLIAGHEGDPVPMDFPIVDCQAFASMAIRVLGSEGQKERNKKRKRKRRRGDSR